MQDAIVPDDLIDAKEAGTLLSLSAKTMRRYGKRGLLPAYTLRGTRTMRFSRADVLAMAQRIEAGASIPTRAEVLAAAKWVDETLRKAGVRR